MKRLDDIVERNRRALRPRRSWLGYMFDEIADAFDTSIPREERRPKQIAIAIVGLAIAGIIATYLLWPRGGAPGGKVHTRHGDIIELASLWEHRRVVVVFYPGRGCDCDSTLQDLEDHRGSFDADLIAISSHSSTYAEQLHERLKLGYEIYVDPAFQVIPDWDVPFMIANATTWAVFIVEPGGQVSYKHIGQPIPSWDDVAARTRKEAR